MTENYFNYLTLNNVSMNICIASTYIISNNKVMNIKTLCMPDAKN